MWTNRSVYESDMRMRLRRQETQAQAVYDDPQAAQEQVNTAYDVLLQAIFGLREIPDKSKLEVVAQGSSRN